MSLSDIKVRRDDDRLAHGIVKSRHNEIVANARRDSAMIFKAKSAEAMIEALKKHLGKRLVTIEAKRLKGSRAKVSVMCAESCTCGTYVLYAVYWLGDQKQKIHFVPLSLAVDQHAVARAVHRTVGCGDVDEAVRVIFNAVLHWNDAPSLKEGERAILRGFGGEARVIREDGYVIVKTWLDVEDLPEWKRKSAIDKKLTVEFQR